MAKQPAPTTIPPHVLQVIFDKAEREGRLGKIEDWRCICDGCGMWVPGIYQRTLNRKNLCACCAGGKVAPAALAICKAKRRENPVK